MKRKTALVLCLLLSVLCLLCACGKQEPRSVDLSKLYDDITARPDFPEMLRSSETEIRNFYGIDPAGCPQLILAVCDDGLRVDEVWLIEADSESRAEELLALAQSRIAQLCTETESYLPDQNAVAKNGQALRIGRNVGLFVSPEAGELARLFRESFNA